DQVTVVGGWAGAPLVGSAGRALGVLWVADHRAGQLSPVQLRTLQLLARQAVLLLEAGAPGEP
nr:GAF domain-containing protein [Ottowia sp.]